MGHHNHSYRTVGSMEVGGIKHSADVLQVNGVLKEVVGVLGDGKEDYDGGGEEDDDDDRTLWASEEPRQGSRRNIEHTQDAPTLVDRPEVVHSAESCCPLLHNCSWRMCPCCQNSCPFCNLMEDHMR